MNNAANSTNIDVGIAGSITMSILTIAVALLLVSFYRRYMKASKKSEDDKN